MKHPENHSITTIPKTVFTRRPSPEGYALVSTGNITLPGAICVVPVDSGDPVLSASVTSRTADETVFAFQGKFTVPLLKKITLMKLSGHVRTIQQPDGSFTVQESRAEGMLQKLTLTPSITIPDGRILCTGCRYKTQFHLQGTIHIRNHSLHASGAIDAPIQLSTQDQLSWGINTLISHARVQINRFPLLENGTIRFTCCSDNTFTEKLVRTYDENDELLFQINKSIPLGTMSITGVSDAPVTLWVELQSLMQEPPHLLLQLFPCRLITEYTGEKTMLFLHGKQYDEPFTLHTNTPWTARVSSNVFLHLVAPDDPSGKALVTSSVFLEGTLAADGMQPPTLQLSVNGLMQGTIFSDTPVAQRLPDQQFTCTISSSGEPECSLEVDTPLHLADNAVISSQNTGSERIRCSLCREGLYFEDVYLQKNDRTEPATVYRCIVNGEGHIISLE